VTDSSNQIRIFRLTDVTTRLRDILLPATDKKFWVKAQFVPDRNRNSAGHLYGNLVETDAAGREVAKLRVMVWKNDLDRIEATLKGRGPELLAPLRAGGEVCACCSIRFHAVYGLSLTIFDLDPDLGESQLDRNKRLVLEALQREGLLDKNKQHGISVTPLRIGLVTATGSAAHADFERTLIMSGFAFQIVHVAATMQGATTVTSVVAAIQSLQARPLDLICVIRGGGSPLDLAWLDHELIARAVAACQLPVWVGIGHEIDTGVLDHVAHTSHKTPTAAAEALVARLREVENRLVTAADRLSEASVRLVDLAARNLAIKENGLKQGARKHQQIQNERFESRVHRLESTLTEQTAELEGELRTAVTLLEDRTRRIVEQGEASLQAATARACSDTASRCESAADVLMRAKAGLLNGSRKHQMWFEERLSRRLERCQATVRIAGTQRETGLIAAQRRLEQATRASLSRSETAVGTAQARLEVGFRAGLEMFIRTLEWKGMALKGVLKVFDRESERLTELQKRVAALSPENLLGKGYSITRTADGRLVRSAADVAAGEAIVTQVRDGIVTSIVERTQEQANGQ
jgi:exodeoxyribonuclease VII large subunit